MVCNIQNYWVFGLCPSSGTLEVLNIIHHRQNPLESTYTISMDPVYALPLGNLNAYKLR
jgi:hypothetical protein